MEQAKQNRNIMLVIFIHSVRELIETSSSSDNDEELEGVERYLRKRKNVPRVENYVEITVPALTD